MSTSSHCVYKGAGFNTQKQVTSDNLHKFQCTYKKLIKYSRVTSLSNLEKSKVSQTIHGHCWGWLQSQWLGWWPKNLSHCHHKSLKSCKRNVRRNTTSYVTERISINKQKEEKYGKLLTKVKDSFCAVPVR